MSNVTRRWYGGPEWLWHGGILGGKILLATPPGAFPMNKTEYESHPKVAAARNVIATLEDIVMQRGLRKKNAITGRYRESDFLKLRIEKILRGVEECRDLVELNPLHAEGYLDQFGAIAAECLVECKRQDEPLTL